MLINIERTAFLEVNSLQKYKKLFSSEKKFTKLSLSTNNNYRMIARETYVMCNVQLRHK